jgi:hypothetical protein
VFSFILFMTKLAFDYLAVHRCAEGRRQLRAPNLKRLQVFEKRFTCGPFNPR